MPQGLEHFLLFPAPHGGAFVTFCTLLKLIPTYIPGWGGGGLGAYFDWCITGSSSISNENVTDSVTQEVSGNNFSSTSNISNAVEREVEVQDCVLASVNESDFEQHNLIPYLVVVEERNKKQLQNSLNRLNLL